jgi:hypothetical protein
MGSRRQRAQSVAAPNAAWRLSDRFANAGNCRSPGMVLKRATMLRMSNVITGSLSADALFRRRDVQYRKIELKLLQRRYAELQRRGHRLKWRQRHHGLEYLLVRQQYWSAALSGDGTAEGINLSGLASDDVMVTTEGANSIVDSATSSDTMQDGNSSGDNGGSLAKVGTDTLTLSGGSMPDTYKVAVDADGTLQLFSAPDWSFNAKVGGEFAPDTSKADAGGTLQLFTTPNWSFTAKFDGEFAPQPQFYAGSGTLRHTW